MGFILSRVFLLWAIIFCAGFALVSGTAGWFISYSHIDLGNLADTLDFLWIISGSIGLLLSLALIMISLFRPKDVRDRRLEWLAILLLVLAVFVPILLPFRLVDGPRSLVSRVRLDLRTIGIALEAYYSDEHSYPERLDILTTPVAYIASLPSDRFSHPKGKFMYHGGRSDWILWSPGPDKRYDITDPIVEGIYESSPDDPIPALLPLTYDVTNGSESAGDIWRVKN